MLGALYKKIKEFFIRNTPGIDAKRRPRNSVMRVTYKEPDAVCVQYFLLMMSTILLETCRGI